MYETLLNAAIPVCSVIIGMVGQHYLSRTARHENATRDKRIESYASYLASVSKRKFAAPDKLSDATIALVAAKAHIAVHGSNEVVRALAEFEADPQLVLPTSKAAFIRIIKAMRTDGYVASVTDDELHWIMFSEPQQSAQD